MKIHFIYVVVLAIAGADYLAAAESEALDVRSTSLPSRTCVPGPTSHGCRTAR